MQEKPVLGSAVLQEDAPLSMQALTGMVSLHSSLKWDAWETSPKSCCARAGGWLPVVQQILGLASPAAEFKLGYVRSSPKPSQQEQRAPPFCSPFKLWEKPDRELRGRNNLLLLLCWFWIYLVIPKYIRDFFQDCLFVCLFSWETPEIFGMPKHTCKMSVFFGMVSCPQLRFSVCVL